MEFKVSQGELFDDLSKDFVLSRVSQVEIFQRFLGITVEVGPFFCSPLRTDQSPTCSFKWFDGKLYYRDWAEPRTKDCFNVVEEMYDCNFYEALAIISDEFGLVDKDVDSELKERVKQLKDRTKKQKSNKSVIKVKSSEFTKQDVSYLSSYELDSSVCKKYNVFGLKHVWINGYRFWSYSDNDPAIGYYFGRDEGGDGKWKIYFYDRSEGMRFLCNTNRIQGWVQLPDKGENVVLTKSLKDVMVLDKLGVNSIAMQNETTMPYPRIIEELRSRFKNIFSLYDFDMAGIRLANKLKREYGIPPLFFTNGRFGSYDYKAKDVSDYVQENGLSATKSLIEHLKYDLNKLTLFNTRSIF